MNLITGFESDPSKSIAVDKALSLSERDSAYKPERIKTGWDKKKMLSHQSAILAENKKNDKGKVG